MNPTTLNTLINTAQIIMQGADKLMQVVRSRGAAVPDYDIPATLEGLRQQLDRVQQRLDADDEAEVEQLRLIEQLAKQNETLTATLQEVTRKTRQANLLAAAALILCLGTLLLVGIILT
jgi:hypothetical protein